MWLCPECEATLIFAVKITENIENFCLLSEVHNLVDDKSNSLISHPIRIL